MSESDPINDPLNNGPLTLETASAATGATESPLIQRTARGFLWMLSQTIGVKIINVAGQIILARYLLTKQDFGLYALALTISAFGGLFQQAGLNTILIHRGKEFDRWATPAFWMSTAYGMFGAVFMLACAPLAQRMYHQSPTLVALISILALRCVIDAFSVVPIAKLEIDMRYRFVGLMGTASNLFATAAMIVLAYFGFGAYSFVLPLPFASAGRAAAAWLATRPAVAWRPQFSLWGTLAKDSLTLLLTNVFFMVTSVGGTMVLGIFCPAAIVGLYAVASNFASQTGQLLTSNVGQVLLPALTKVDTPERQTQAFIDVAGLLTWVGVPTTVLQAVLARPIILLLFGPRWVSGAPILAIVSIGMGLHIANAPAVSLMRAQGRFRRMLWTGAASACVYLPAIIIGASIGGAVGVAWATTAYMGLFGFIWVTLVFGVSRAAVRMMGRIYLAPLAVSALAALPFVLVDRWTVVASFPTFARIILAAVSTGALYIGASSLLLPTRTKRFFALVRQTLLRSGTAAAGSAGNVA